MSAPGPTVEPAPPSSKESAPGGATKRPLAHYAWVSVGAALTTIALKSFAYLLTGSVGLLSDALESGVNLVAALMAVWMLRLAATPPDARHEYGHAKAEYFSSALEGLLIFVTALLIGWTAIARLLAPRPLEGVGLGLGLSTGASLINLGVGQLLLRVGRREHSLALEADGHHLMTDVWTSVGVIAGVAIVALTGWLWLDPVIALAVALQILRTGVSLIGRSGGGLLDSAIPSEERDALVTVLDRYASDGATWHALRTRQAGRRRFMEVHVLVPGAWTVQRAHDLVEHLEAEVRAAVPHLRVHVHLEPLEDPRAHDDHEL
jgi:cation diffusion facilitator family transporter